MPATTRGRGYRSALGEGQIRTLPGEDAAAEVVHLLEAVLAQDAARARRLLAGPAGGNDRSTFVFFQLVDLFCEPIERNVEGVQYVALIELAVTAHVNDDRILVVDEPRDVRWAEPGVASPGSDECPNQRAEQHEEGGA